MGDDARAGNLSYYSLDNTGSFRTGTGYYKYHWWGLDRGKGDYDYYAAGNFGQYIYVCPSNKVIIVRNGTGYGNVDGWPSVFFKVAGQL